MPRAKRSIQWNCIRLATCQPTIAIPIDEPSERVTP
jgi:hypothetical protein